MKILVQEKLSPNMMIDNSGFLICTNAVLARTGIQQYRHNELFTDGTDEMIDVDRPENEVFSDKTIASFENKPIVDEHPNVDVNTENYKDLAVGYVRDVHKGLDNGQQVLLGTLVITDANTIKEVQDGKRQLSCGYDCDILTTDEGGYYQSHILGNHVALCEEGRAGIARIVDSKVEDASNRDLEKIAEDLEHDSYYIKWSALNEFRYSDGYDKGTVRLEHGKIVFYNEAGKKIAEYNSRAEYMSVISDSVNDTNVKDAFTEEDLEEAIYKDGNHFIQIKMLGRKDVMIDMFDYSKEYGKDYAMKNQRFGYDSLLRMLNGRNYKKVKSYKDSKVEDGRWVKSNSVYDVLDEYLTWEGIIGYTGQILDVWKDKDCIIDGEYKKFKTSQEALEAFLDWEGIYGYTREIVNIIKTKRAYIDDSKKDKISKALDAIKTLQKVQCPTQKITDEQNSYKYKDTVIIKTSYGWKFIVNGQQLEVSTSKEAEEIIDNPQKAKTAEKLFEAGIVTDLGHQDVVVFAKNKAEAEKKIKSLFKPKKIDIYDSKVKDEYAHIYKGITIRPILGRNNRKLYVVEYNDNPADWPEYVHKENAEKFVDILISKGEEAANKSWKFGDTKDSYDISYDLGHAIKTEHYESKEEADKRYEELLKLSKKPSMSGLNVKKLYKDSLTSSDKDKIDYVIENLEHHNNPEEALKLMKNYYSAYQELAYRKEDEVLEYLKKNIKDSKVKDTAMTITTQCYIFDGSKVLIQDRVGPAWKGLAVPGGHVKVDENIAQSCIREVEEETGLTVSNLEIFGGHQYISEEDGQCLAVLYKTNTFKGNIHSSEEGEIMWMDINDVLASDKCADGFKQLLSQCIRKSDVQDSARYVFNKGDKLDFINYCEYGANVPLVEGQKTFTFNKDVSFFSKKEIENFVHSELAKEYKSHNKTGWMIYNWDDLKKYKVKDMNIPIANVDAERYVVGQQGVWFARAKGESELLTTAYYSNDNGQHWHKCTIEKKSVNNIKSGTQVNKVFFRANNPRVSIGRNILTWYANEGLHNVDYSYDIDHFDEDYKNDALSNLQRITHAENVRKNKIAKQSSGK